MLEEIKAALEPKKEEILVLVKRARIFYIIIGIEFVLMIASLVVCSLSGMEIFPGIGLMPSFIGFFVIFALLAVTVGINYYMSRNGRRNFGVSLGEELIGKIYNSFLKEKSKTTKINGFAQSTTKKGLSNELTFENELFRYKFSTETWKEISISSGLMSNRYRRNTRYVYYVIYRLLKLPIEFTAIGDDLAIITTDSLGSHKSVFESESIEFNKRFNVNGKDLQKITRFFSPSQIQKMLDVNKNAFTGRKISIFSNSAGVPLSKSTTRWDPHYALSDFSADCISYNMFIKKMVKKVTKDMKVFMQLRETLSPFDFEKE